MTAPNAITARLLIYTLAILAALLGPVVFVNIRLQQIEKAGEDPDVYFNLSRDYPLDKPASSSSGVYLSEETILQNTILSAQPIVEAHRTFAQNFVFDGIPSGRFTEFCSEKYGFCFWYPKRWGTFTLKSVQWICENPDVPSLDGTFSSSSYFLSSSSFFAVPKDECKPMGMDSIPENPYRSLKDADATFAVSGSNDEGGTWFTNTSTAFLVYHVNMITTVPTNHPLHRRIVFGGPEMKDLKTSEEDIHDFLVLSRSFRALPL